MTRVFPLVLIVLSAVVVPAAARAVTIPADTTAILSGAPSLFAPLPAPVADSDSSAQAVSANGRFVAFSSNSDGLSADDDDSVENVYVKDQMTGAVTLASRQTGAAGAPADRNCSDPAISDNGLRVAFECNGPLDPADTNNTTDVYLRDLQSNQTFLVSRATQLGAVGDQPSAVPALSSDGTRVAFESQAGNFGGPMNGDDEIYARDIPIGGGTPAANVTRLVSAALNPAEQPNDDSDNPSISNNGDVVAFESDATNLVTGDNNGVTDAFVRTISGGTTQLASRKDGATGTLGDNSSDDAQIDGAGTIVVFRSFADNLDDLDNTSDGADVYKRILGVTQDTVLVDQAGGHKLTAGAGRPAVDDTGGTIAFVSETTAVDPADTSSNEDVYVARGGQLKLASRGDGPAGVPANTFSQPSVSGDGTHVIFASAGSLTGDAIPAISSVAERDLDTNSTTTVSKPGVGGTFDNIGGGSESASMSADGRLVAFSSSAPALGVPPDAQNEIVVRDTATGGALLVSREDGAGGAPMPGSSTQPSISADGRFVAFQSSPQGGLEVAAPTSKKRRLQRGVLLAESTQVFVRDLVTGSTVEVSRPNTSTTEEGDSASFSPHISADGRHVEFISFADNLVGGDNNDNGDAFVRDLETNETVLASRADGAGGDPGNRGTFTAALSADGRHVAFETDATNLGDGDADNSEDIHVRDLDAHTTRLASITSAGQNIPSHAFEPSIDAHGNRVAFSAQDSFDGSTVPDGVQEVWVHDFSAGNTLLASRADGAAGDPATARSDFPVLSASGNVVAFDTEAGLLPGLPPDTTQVVRRDLGAGTTRLVSRGPGPDGPAVTTSGFVDSVTADGACVAFDAEAPLFGPVPGAFDHFQSYLRAFATDCGRPPLSSGGGPPVRDTTAPVLRSVKLTRTRFRATRASSAAAGLRVSKIGRGTELRFISSEAGRISVKIERALPGRKSGKGRRRRCRVVSHKVRHGGCTAFRKATTIKQNIRAGRGKVKLTGRLHGRKMPAGAYRLTVTARDKAGNVSRGIRRSFRILPG